MPKLIILGNCLSERLARLLTDTLPSHPTAQNSAEKAWRIVPTKPVYNAGPEELAQYANMAKNCDLVFSQPLFNYGPCNTEDLASALGDRLKLFSAPNFAAYFPDALPVFATPRPPAFPPPLEWHSSVILDCRFARVPPAQMEAFYLNHPIFSRKRMQMRIQESLREYARRDAGVHISTYELVKEYYAKEPLFHTLNHPGDRVIHHLVNGILTCLGWNDSLVRQALSRIAFEDCGQNWSSWGFGFNAWPIICGQHDLFSFPSRNFFRIAGAEYDLLTVILSYYNFYDQHPQILEQAVKIRLRAARNR